MERTVSIFQPNTSPENLLIRQIWSTKDTQAVIRTEKILPKGTAEIIFNFSDNIASYRSEEKNTIYLPKCFINGLNFSPVNLTIKDKQYFLGIQFNVFALKYIFNIPVTEFNDQVLEGALVCNSLDRLAEQLSVVTSFQEQVAAIITWLRSKVKNTALLETNNRIIKLHADTEIINLSVNAISQKYHVTSRQLSRLCHDYLGMCTEDVILYRKYLTALHQMHQPHASLTEITYNCSFYDQPHFARTFKLFTGLTPKQYKQSSGELPGHILEIIE